MHILFLGFYNINNGGQPNSSQYFITLSASIAGSYPDGSYWGIDSGLADCRDLGSGDNKITTNLFVYNYCAGNPCVTNTSADPFTSNWATFTVVVSYAVVNQTLGIISSGTGASLGGALWSTYGVSASSFTSAGGSGTNGNTPAGIVISCIAPLACTAGQ